MVENISNFRERNIVKNSEESELGMNSLQNKVKEVLPKCLGGSNIICGASLEDLAQRIDEIELSLRNAFPNQGILRFDAGDLLTHTKEVGDYVLNKLSETQGNDMILINGLEKILPSESAQQLFLELYVAWHAAGKMLFITTTAPLRNGMGWNEKLLRRLEWANVYKL